MHYTFHTLLDKGVFKITEAIESGIDINTRDSITGKTLLLFALEDKKACRSIHLITFLLENGADVNIRDGRGQNALLIALKNSDTPSGVIEKLFSYHVDINIADIKGDTSLHIAVQNHNFNLVRQLLEKGANINAQNTKGRTPLFFALITPKPSDDMVAFLIEQGADLSIPDKKGRTPLLFACTTPNIHEVILNRLLDNNLSANIPDYQGNTPLIKMSARNDISDGLKGTLLLTVLHLRITKAQRSLCPFYLEHKIAAKLNTPINVDMLSRFIPDSEIPLTKKLKYIRAYETSSFQASPSHNIAHTTPSLHSN